MNERQSVTDAKSGPDVESQPSDNDWEEAVRDALQKKRPPDGWPWQQKRRKKDQDNAS